MLRYALPRFYFALAGVLLFTLPVFAVMRFDMHNKTICAIQECVDASRPGLPRLLVRDGPFYAVWQTGLPPYDYWPLAVALLAAGAAFEAIMTFRSRRRSV